MAQAKRGREAGHPSPEPPPLDPRAPQARRGYRGWEDLDGPTLLALGSPCHCVRHPEAPMPWAQEDADPAHAPTGHKHGAGYKWNWGRPQEGTA